MRLGKLATGLAAVATLGGPAEAAVRYTFTGVATTSSGAVGNPTPVSGGFSVVLPDYATTSQFVGSFGTPTDYCTTSVGSGCYAFLGFDAFTFPYGPGDRVVLRSNSSNTNYESLYTFAPGVFTSYGTKLSTGTNAATLTVSDAGTVPEPATWAMMIGGMGLVGAAMRRQRSRTAIKVATV